MKFAPALIAAIASLLCFVQVGSAQATKCPVINGEYKRQVKVDGKDYTVVFEYYTRQEGGIFSYSNITDTDKTYYPADGVARPIRSGDRYGKATLTCKGRTLVIVTQEDGSAQLERVELTEVNASQITIVHPTAERNGLYTKE